MQLNRYPCLYTYICIFLRFVKIKSYDTLARKLKNKSLSIFWLTLKIGTGLNGLVVAW